MSWLEPERPGISFHDLSVKAMISIPHVDIAAFVISALAFIASASAVIYARSQAHSTKKMALIEERRHNLELERAEQDRVALLTADLGIAVGPALASIHRRSFGDWPQSVRARRRG